MTEEARRRLEEIRQEMRLAATAITSHQDSFECCERLVDALSAVIRFLEVEQNQT
jgi:hypothetical protein